MRWNMMIILSLFIFSGSEGTEAFAGGGHLMTKAQFVKMAKKSQWTNCGVVKMSKPLRDLSYGVYVECHQSQSGHNDTQCFQDSVCSITSRKQVSNIK